MRTTLTLADDVQAEVDRLRREHNIGVSDAVNQLARRGMSVAGTHRQPVVPRTAPLGMRVDVSNIGEVLALLDEDENLPRDMLLDANLLLYATDQDSPRHGDAHRWLSGVLNGAERVALPWQTIGAFLRIATNPRVMTRPATAPEAWAVVTGWLDAEVTWIPPASARTAELLGELVNRHHVTANLIPDAQLAALAWEHGQTVVSADSDFARFPEVRWVNPLRE